MADEAAALRALSGKLGTPDPFLRRGASAKPVVSTVEAEAVEGLLLSPKGGRQAAPPAKRRRTAAGDGDGAGAGGSVRAHSDLKDLLRRVSTQILAKLQELAPVSGDSSTSTSTSSNSSNSSTSNSAGADGGSKLVLFSSEAVCDSVVQSVMLDLKKWERVSVEQWQVEELVAARAKDTLNVLLATGAVVRAPKDARRLTADPDNDLAWVGLPRNTRRELQQLQRERSVLVRRIDKKHRYLQELVVQIVAMENLAKRNKNRVESPSLGERIPLPFIVVSTDRDTVIECDMAADQSDICFNFNKPFRIHDDAEVLKRMQLAKADPAFLRTILPSQLLDFVPSEVVEEQQQQSE